jgi:uncharacterized protein (DUF4415 family)
MQIAFNPANDAINLAKHGVSLALAKQFDWLTGRVHSARTVGGEQPVEVDRALRGSGVRRDLHSPRRGVLDHQSAACQPERKASTMKGTQRYGVPDEENPEWTAKEIRTAKPFAEVFPDTAAATRRRGPQKTPTKRPVSLRLDPDVLAAYRATGKGWQARMNATLAAHAPSRVKRRVRRMS